MHVLICTFVKLVKIIAMANNSNSMVQYEGFLTVVLHKPTYPRPSLQISAEEDRELEKILAGW